MVYPLESRNELAAIAATYRPRHASRGVWIAGRRAYTDGRRQIQGNGSIDAGHGSRAAAQAFVSKLLGKAAQKQLVAAGFLPRIKQ